MALLPDTVSGEEDLAGSLHGGTNICKQVRAQFLPSCWAVCCCSLQGVP